MLYHLSKSQSYKKLRNWSLEYYSNKFTQIILGLLIWDRLGLDLLTFNSSTSTFRNVTSGVFLAKSARIGAIKRHGAHHEAVKSTTTYQSSFLCYGIKKFQEILKRTKAEKQMHWFRTFKAGTTKANQTRPRLTKSIVWFERYYNCNKEKIKGD